MHRNWTIAFSLAACLIGLTILSEETPAGVRAGDPARQEPGHAHWMLAPRTVIASVKVSPTEQLRYELSVAPCRQKDCPFRVRLMHGKTPLTAISLDWVKASGVLAQETVDESSGAGDPLQPDTNQSAWSTGAEKENVSTVARAVRLSPELTGLLIDRRAGFDVLKRHHDLVVAVNRKLLLAWSDADGVGPSWSTVALSTAGKDQSQDVLSFSGFRSQSNDDSDRLNFRIYHWNSSQSKLDEVKTPKVFAVIAGAFDSASKARAVQNSHSCLNSFWVLQSDAFSKLRSGKFVLAAVTGREELAARQAVVVRSCAAELEISVIRSPYRQLDE